MSHQNHCPIHGDHSCSCCPKCHEICHEHFHGEAPKEDCLQNFLELADQAWMEVLKEKIKEHILATKGAHLKELAKIISEANQKRWQNKIAAKHGEQEFRDDVCEFMKKKHKG
jgi:hypothetical protein